MKTKSDFTFLETTLIGGVASCFAEFVTLPIDTVKVRMQNFQDIYRRFYPSFARMYAEEGLGAFYRGLTVVMLRQCSYSALRIGMYDYLLQELGNAGVGVSMRHQVLVGMVSGSVSIAIANPLDVLKVKFQSDMVPAMRDGKMVPSRRNYKSLQQAAAKIYRVEGFFRGYYLSLWPNVIRCSIVNTIELVTFSQLQALLRLAFWACSPAARSGTNLLETGSAGSTTGWRCTSRARPWRGAWRCSGGLRRRSSSPGASTA